MNDTSKFQRKWETGKEKEACIVDVASPIMDLEISRKPLSTTNDTSKFQKKWKIGQENEELLMVLASPITDMEIFGKL